MSADPPSSPPPRFHDYDAQWPGAGALPVSRPSRTFAEPAHGTGAFVQRLLRMMASNKTLSRKVLPFIAGTAQGRSWSTVKLPRNAFLVLGDGDARTALKGGNSTVERDLFDGWSAEDVQANRDLIKTIDDLTSNSMIFVHGKVHGFLKQPVASALTRRRNRDVVIQVRKVINRQITQAADVRRLDVKRLAELIYATTVASILDASSDEVMEMLVDIELVQKFFNGDRAPETAHLAVAAIERLSKPMERLLDCPQVDPDDSIGSVLAGEVIKGNWTLRQAVAQLLSIPFGAAVIDGAATELCAWLTEHPDVLLSVRQWIGDGVKDSDIFDSHTVPDIADLIIEEVLATRPIVPFVGRSAMGAFDLGRHSVRPGDRLLIYLGHRSRCPAGGDMAFSRPGPHLTFSSGPHMCPGALLARMVLKVLLVEMAQAGVSLSYHGDRIRKPGPGGGFNYLMLDLRADTRV